MISEKRAIELKIQAAQIRKELLKSIHSIGIGHVGGSLSVAELLAVLYFEKMNVRPEEPKWPDRDRLVMSKGHSGPAVYASLGLKGYFPVESILTLNKPGTSFPSHCDMRRTVGIDMTTGSLGQGISAAMGIAVACKADKRSNYVYFVIGDGESQEGQVWESALFAGHRRLDNVIGFVDFNGLQIDGTTDQVCSLGDIGAKFADFGWHVQSIDGHDPAAIANAIDEAKAVTGKPSIIILNTVKGKGIRSIENKISNHSMSVDDEFLASAIDELDDQIKAQEALLK